jgi:hypothetical protein
MYDLGNEINWQLISSSLTNRPIDQSLKLGSNVGFGLIVWSIMVVAVVVNHGCCRPGCRGCCQRSKSKGDAAQTRA